MTQNSAPPDQVRPEDLMEELGIKKDAYYADLKYLGIQPVRDSEGKAWLTTEDADRIRSLRSFVEQNGKRSGFEESGIVKRDDSNLTASTDDIYTNPEEPTAQFDLDKLMRDAAQLKAREIAMPHLVKRAVADRMSEDDLPEDLKEKVELAREAANPKYTPAEVAQTMLEQWRSSRRIGD